MRPASKPTWQQMTALLSLSTSGAMTGFSLIPGTAAADLTSPAGTQVRLMALHTPSRPAPAGDAALRFAIVNVADYYLRLAQGKTPAEMEALIWQHDSIDGVDHGASCAAFASLTLELAAQVVGQQSWVTGGTSYPWPLHKWADARVGPNPASPGIVSALQDAQAHGRWHPVGDGYRPRPGDWVLFDGHVEVVTGYKSGVLRTIGADSLPNLTVNAHEFSNPLSAQGVIGFVNNGAVARAHKRAHADAPPAAVGQLTAARQAPAPGTAAIPGAPGAGSPAPAAAAPAAAAPASGTSVAVTPVPSAASGPGRQPTPTRHRARPLRPGTPVGGRAPGRAHHVPRQGAPRGGAAIPGASGTGELPSADGPSRPAFRYTRHQPAPTLTPQPGVGTQQAFIAAIAPGALAAQRQYGVPASVTIAQAIDESGWGQSYLSVQDHNLFGIKGAGPAGSDLQPTQEYQNGQLVARIASFRVYNSAAQSIDDHGQLLATSPYYTQAMAQRQHPDAFANALTGVYATDPGYGQKLIGLMRQYDLYRYDRTAHAVTSSAAAPGRTSEPGHRRVTRTLPGGAAIPGPSGVNAPGVAGGSAPASSGAAEPGPARGATPAPTRVTSPPPARVTSSPTAGGAPLPTTATKPRQGGTPPPGSPGAGPSKQRAAAASAASRAAPPGGGAGPAMGATGGNRRDVSRQAKAGGTLIPGVSDPVPVAQRGPSTQSVSATPLGAPAGQSQRRIMVRDAMPNTNHHHQHIPVPVKNAFVAMAKVPLTRAEPLYRDVASHSGISWQLLAACDWMQCKAKPRYSPVYGEKLGTVNPDGTAFRTKSAALARCADDLVELADAVYHIDVTSPGHLTVRDLAKVFAAFRWGGLLAAHRTSAMEFPYSVEGLSVQHMHMRWPNIDEPNAPDKPGRRFHMPFGAVPIVLSLNYPAATE